MKIKAIEPIAEKIGVLKGELVFPAAAALIAAGAVAVLIACDAGTLPTAVLIGTLLAWSALFWAMARRLGGVHRKKMEAVDAEVDLITTHTGGLLRSLERELKGQFGIIRTENTQVQEILADAIGKLIGNFTNLQDHTSRQQELSMGLTGKGAASRDGEIGFDAMLKEIDAVLEAFIGAASKNSRVAKSLVAQMNETSTQFQAVLKMLKEVKKIADQTNLLAINAAVEAARAGQAGRGFAVVAEEVRHLSVNSNKFSNEISESVSGIAGALGNVETAINAMASEETKMVEAAQAQMSELMDKVKNFNRNIEESAGELSVISEQVGHEVRSAVTSLQFQDMSTQVLGHVNGRTETMDGVLAQISALPLSLEIPQEDPAGCDERLRHFGRLLGEASVLVENVRHNPVSQKSMDEGDIELF